MDQDMIVNENNIFNMIGNKAVWDAFLQYKIERQHLSQKEEKELRSFIEEERYIEWSARLRDTGERLPLPIRREINKGGTSKKRIIYSYPPEMNQMLKIIAYCLYEYDGVFSKNCYAFRREYGVKDAIHRIRTTGGIARKYCLKVDIHNYFNSIDVEILLEKLSFLKGGNEELYGLFERLLTADEALVKVEDGRYETVQEKRGAMAGIPVSPFFANVYLKDTDAYFEKRGILYFRYSDDILIFADTKEQLQEYRDILYEKIRDCRLERNPDKVMVCEPGQMWEFLGFCYRDGKVDLADHTIRKMKHKMKRKAEALRRWQRKKGLSGDKAAKGFIKAMNYKFFAREEGTEFTWCRWFFPNITTDKGLKELDAYMQQCIRYCVTGRYYKGNYRIRYEQMKEWGYRNLVAEYYKGMITKDREKGSTN